MFRAVLLCCLAAVSLTNAAVKLATLVTPCSIKDPKLDDCLTTQGKLLVPHLVEGIKDWGILTMDPLFVPLMQLQRNDDSSIGLSINVKNSSQYGWKDMEIKSIKLDPTNYRFDVSWVFPRYKMIGEAETRGRIILLPISGHGPANITFIDATIDMTVKCAPEKKGSKMYLKVTDTKVNLKIKNMMMILDNLFNNKDLSASMNKVLNENAIDIFEELRPNIEENFTGIVSTLLGRMFSKIPLNQLFEDFE